MTGDTGKGKGNSEDKSKHKAARTKHETVRMVVNSTCNSKAIAHTARSGDTNARIVDLGWHSRRMVHWLVFRSRKQRVAVSSPCNGVMLTVILWNWIRRVGVLQP